MLSKVLNKPVKDDFVIVDSIFPQKEPFAFRNREINQYLKLIKNAASYTMYPMKPGSEAWFSHGYGMTSEQYAENRRGYLTHYPQNADKIHYLSPKKSYSFKLAYSFFLAETFVLLPFLEKNKIPFVFVLYPGGAFGLDNKQSDAMLGRIFESPYFKGVIVTQRLTEKYLLRKKLCPPEKINYIFGGFVQFDESDVLPKERYKEDKQTFDICFVAAKYSERGVDKGYDLFIETAKHLAKSARDIRFHVIGGFDENEIDVTELGDQITFYGYKKPDFLKGFYSKMDILLSPNRPYKLYEGNFDGFPMGGDAGFCGVGLFMSDELKMNEHYTDGKDIVLLPLDAKEIAGKVLHYYNNPHQLYDLAERGQRKTHELLGTDVQIDARIRFFKQFTDLEVTHV